MTTALSPLLCYGEEEVTVRVVTSFILTQPQHHSVSTKQEKNSKTQKYLSDIFISFPQLCIRPSYFGGKKIPPP